jgi:YrbI family 3-deoxy-D-manno-octulosonate 8-phosphate phosphatase
MRSYGYPVVFDATHAVQKPGGQGTSTGGNREMVPYLMRAALAVGVDAVFAEVHPDPDHAFSDGPNQIHLSNIRKILEEAVAIDDLIKGNKETPGDKETRRQGGSELKTQNSKLNIKLFLTDVDGVLTDAGMYYSENGDELKKFNTHDGMGLQLIRQKGIKTGIITSENTMMVERRFNKLKLDYLYQGKREGGKLASALEICEKEGITLQNVAYIGDDINCLELLSHVGLAACPANALDAVKQIPGIVRMNKKGGEGCVREFIELILNRHNDTENHDEECELGYWLGKPFWGRGYMPEAAREMIRHGFEDLGMNTIWCGYFEGNQKSKRVQEKIGFVYHHTREKVSVPLMKEVRTEHRNIMTKERWMAEREKNCGKV